METYFTVTRGTTAQSSAKGVSKGPILANLNLQRSKQYTGTTKKVSMCTYMYIGTS
jgi:hypothetical protein